MLERGGSRYRYLLLVCSLFGSKAWTLPLFRHAVNTLESMSRRSWLSRASTILVGFTAVLPPSDAAVTDETDNFATNWWSSSPADLPLPTTKARPTATDEVHIVISKEDLRGNGLGLELAEIEFRTNLRVYVKSVQPNSLGEAMGIQKDWIVVSINGQSTERTNAQGVTQILLSAIRDKSDSVDFCFRDPSIFREKLQNLSPNESVTTQVAPAGDTTQRRSDGSVKPGRSVTSQTDQKVTVTQLMAPPMCQRGATTDDLLEISYVGRVLETGQIFDGSAVRINNEGIPGRGNDVSLYFVLGKQPFGQFPPGWDVGLVGMCVGERRRLIIPPGLAYGSGGLPRRGIPPDATLQYDISLVSLNGLSTPQ